MNICSAQENQTNSSDCSNLFEGFHPAFTIIQACLSLLFVLLAVPLNLILIVAIIRFRCHVDKAFILCTSIFIANVMVSLSGGTGIFLSSATRSWPLGYVGCQVFGFLFFYPMLARWMTLGMLSIDRFCHVFLPFFYIRHSKIAIRMLLAFPWVAALPINILSLLRVYSKYEFLILFPTCFRQFNCNGSIACLLLTHITITFVLASGSILPIVVYIILYFKSRRLFRATKFSHAPNEQQIADNERRNKATKTFSLMVVTFSIYTIAAVIAKLTEVVPVLKDIKGLQFFVCDIALLYNITDFLIVWKNKDGKQAIKKLIGPVWRKRGRNSGTDERAPTSLSSQERVTTSGSTLITASNEQQASSDPAPPSEPNRSVPVSSHTVPHQYQYLIASGI